MLMTHVYIIGNFNIVFFFKAKNKNSKKIVFQIKNFFLFSLIVSIKLTI